MNEQQVEKISDSTIFAIISENGLSCKQKAYSFDILFQKLGGNRSAIGVMEFRGEKDLKDLLSVLPCFECAKYGFDLYLAYIAESRPAIVVKYYL